MQVVSDMYYSVNPRSRASQGFAANWCSLTTQSLSLKRMPLRSDSTR